MKKKLVVYLAGLLTVLGLGFGQAQFSDVPAGHWAKEAVERIAACGLITGFPDGTFRGNTNLTRYQAALIFQRLLNEIQQGGECVKGQGGGMSEEDMTAIRNAVQELAAELAALGVRVSALEDNAATKDDIARLEAAIEELKAAPAQPEGGMDEAALADLADRVEAASVAADTALAQAQILAERLDGVEGDVAALKTQVEADADSIRALNELAVLLNQDVLSLQDRVTALEKQLGDVDFDSFANKEDVSAIQEFATALRSDLVRLSDRVSNLDTRLTALEAVRFSLTGSISATYGYATLTGTDFDIDRLFPTNSIGSGAGPRAGRIRNAFRRVDFSEDFTGVSGSLNFNLKYASGIISEVSVGTGFDLASAGLDLNRAIKVNSVNVKGALEGQAFEIKYQNDDASFRFNPYLFSNNAAGDVGTIRAAVATINASKLPLAPKFTIVAGDGTTDATNGGGVPIMNGDIGGLRAEVNLLGLNTGLNYAENRGNRSAFGVDWNGNLFGLLNLNGAYVASTPFGQPVDLSNSAITDQAFYVRGGVKLGIIELNANYRAIDPQYEDGRAGMSMDQGYLNFGVASGVADAAPFAANNRGFGVDGTLTLGILGGVTVRGYLDNSTDFFGAAPQSAFGVGARINLFAGFNLVGYFNSAQENNAATNQLSGRGAYGNTGGGYFYNSNDYNPNTSGFGVRLRHDGNASNALIRGLNILLGYDSYNGDAAVSDLQAAASYSLNLGFLTINPLVRYHNFTGVAGAPAGDKYDSYSSLKFGVTGSTQPLGIFFRPSLEGAFATRSTDYAASNDVSETYYRIGLALNEFLTTGSVFRIAYASYSGTNLREPTGAASTVPFAGYGNAVSSISTDRLYAHPSEGWAGQPFGTGVQGLATGTVSGLYLEWKYGNLTMAAVSASVQDAGGTTVSTGNSFKITYEVKF